MIELVSQIWPMIVGLIGLVAWFIRLESKVMAMEKSHSDTRREQIKLNETIQMTLNQILLAVGELKGKTDK